MKKNKKNKKKNSLKNVGTKSETLISDENNKGSEDSEKKSEEELKKQKKLEEEKQKILNDIINANVDTLQQRVAWVLNHHPDARNSDITCQLRFWSIFDKDIYDPMSIDPMALYKLTKLTSISRARAKIQNVHNLFLAKPEVRKQRGKLAEEEKQKALEDTPTYPVFAVYGDESGKTGKHLIVGSMWVLNGIETMHLIKDIDAWRKETDFHRELHFKDISSNKLPRYLEVLEILRERSSSLSFKALSVERKGFKNINDALTQLYLNLLIKGIEHEDSSGRAPLPRSIQFFKDAEQPGSDKLMLEDIKNRMREMAQTVFDKKLYVDEFHAVDSKVLVLIQLADLFTSSINRSLNASGSRTSAKDKFAKAMLKTFGMTLNKEKMSSIGDCAFHVGL